jgi:hypothetical protein
MHPAGLRAIAGSKCQGLRGVMNDVDALVIPDNLAVALEARPPAPRATRVEQAAVHEARISLRPATSARLLLSRWIWSPTERA